MKRLLVPFWAFSLVYVAEIALFRFVSGNDWLAYIKSQIVYLFNGNGCGVMWFLGCLFIAEVIFFFLLKIRNKWLFYFFAAAITAVGLYCSPVFDVIRRAFVAVGFLAVGFIFCKLNINKKILMILSSIVCIIIHIAGIVFNGPVGLSALKWGKSPIVYFVISSVTCIGIMMIFQVIKRPIPIISFFGRESMIVLCVHINVIEALWVLNGNIFHFSWLEGAIMAAVTLAITVPLIYITKRWCPKLVGIWK